MVVVAGWSRIEQPAAAPVPRAETARAARRPTRPASAPRRTPTGVERPLGLAVESAAPPTPPWSEQSCTSPLERGLLGFWSCGPSGEGPLPPCPAGPPLFRPQHRTGGELSPTWSELRKLESTWSQPPQVGVNLESRSRPGVSTQNLERARSDWSELAPTGASSLQVGAKSERVERAKKVLVTWALTR